MIVDPRTMATIANDMVFSMAMGVDEALKRAFEALTESKPLMAADVIKDDRVVNEFEIEIDNLACEAIIFGQLPQETLRLILSIQKINPVLERVGDHAVNIAESAITLVTKAHDRNLFDIPTMTAQTHQLFRDAVSSFFKRDISLAQSVLTRDDEIDKLNILISINTKEAVKTQAMSFETAVEIIRVCKNLERVADLSTNIAEEANFLIGKVVKHHASESGDIFIPLPSASPIRKL